MNIKMTDANRLAPPEATTLRCPACGEEALVTGTCSCGQRLDPREHEATLLNKRDAVMMRPISAREARAFLTGLATPARSGWQL